MIFFLILFFCFLFCFCINMFMYGHIWYMCLDASLKLRFSIWICRIWELFIRAKPLFGFTFHKPRLRFVLFFFFFFVFTHFWRSAATVQWTVAANVDFFQWTVYPCTVHGPHKFHFLSIFSLKIGPTVLFTHLKIILLQWFQQ